MHGCTLNDEAWKHFLASLSMFRGDLDESSALMQMIALTASSEINRRL
jgi:hypothetical protein